MPLKAKSQFYKWVSVYENHVQKKQQNNLLTVWRELCALTFPLKFNVPPPVHGRQLQKIIFKC